MRLLVVGHSYVTAFAQSKYVAMKQLDENLKLRLVVPRNTHDMFGQYKCQIAPGIAREEVVSPWGVFRSHMTYVLDPVRLAMLLGTFKPDHVHIEQDPHSLIGVEIVFLVRLMCPTALISFFIWDNLAREPQFPLNVLKSVLANYALRRSSMVVCGNEEAEQLLRTRKQYGGSTLVLPQLGLDPDKYASAPPPELPKQLGKSSDAILIGYLGRLIPEKGVVLLLEALLRLRHLRWNVLIVGSGPLKEEIQTRWKSLLSDRLVFLDAIPHDAVPNYLKCLDLFVLPSYGTPFWKEQFGLTLAQAMMAGVACIGSSSGAIPGVLGPGGMVFREGDVESLSNVLKILIESKAKRNRFGEQGRAFALQRYTNRAISGAYLAAFMNLKESV